MRHDIGHDAFACRYGVLPLMELEILSGGLSRQLHRLGCRHGT